MSVTKMASHFLDRASCPSKNEDRLHPAPLGRRPNSNRAILFASGDTAERRLAQVRLGVAREHENLAAHLKTVGCDATEQSVCPDLRLRIANQIVTVRGRVDALVHANPPYIIEHKQRCRRLLCSVPIHEKVQCHFYMRMCRLTRCDLLQHFGAHQRLDTITFDPVFWSNVLVQLNASDFVEEERRVWEAKHERGCNDDPQVCLWSDKPVHEHDGECLPRGEVHELDLETTHRVHLPHAPLQHDGKGSVVRVLALL